MTPRGWSPWATKGPLRGPCAVCLGETALDVEGVLKQALLRRGCPIKLVVDNGAAYRANTLQGVCARLGIHLNFCRPYAPEGKGKLERWHRTCRDQFLKQSSTSGASPIWPTSMPAVGLARAGLPPDRARRPGRHDAAGAPPARSTPHPQPGCEGRSARCAVPPPSPALGEEGRHGVLSGPALRGALPVVGQGCPLGGRSARATRRGHRGRGWHDASATAMRVRNSAIDTETQARINSLER